MDRVVDVQCARGLVAHRVVFREKSDKCVRSHFAESSVEFSRLVEALEAEALFDDSAAFRIAFMTSGWSSIDTISFTPSCEA